MSFSLFGNGSGSLEHHAKLQALCNRLNAKRQRREPRFRLQARKYPYLAWVNPKPPRKMVPRVRLKEDDDDNVA
jgi:hypothetical protein